jgi:hypothetical protein
VNIINELLGLPLVEVSDVYGVTKAMVPIDRLLHYGVAYFVKWLEYLRCNPSALK